MSKPIYYCNLTGHSVPSGSVYAVSRGNTCRWVLQPYTSADGDFTTDSYA